MKNLNDQKFENTFTETNEHYSLAIDNYNKIYFPKNRLESDICSNDEWLKNKHLDSKVHEPGMIKALKFLKVNNFKIDNIIDVGAFFGYFSKICDSLFEGAQIYAIEANYHSYKVLESNVAYKSNKIKPFYMGLSNQNSGNITIIYGFRIFDFNLKNLFWLGSRNIYKYILGKSKSLLLNVRKLNLMTLEAFSMKNNFIPDLIKIDVEGYQAMILPVSYEFIIKHKPIILLEFDTQDKLKKFETTNEKLCRPLLDSGYKLYWGDHRNEDCLFVPIEKDTDIDIEKNSLGILIPENS